jgi:hypothetical protein
MHVRVWLFALAALLGTDGCAGARLRVDPAVTRSSLQWDVEGASPRTWGAPLHFGPYRTLSPQDGATPGWSVPVLGAKVASGHAPYAWRITGGAAEVDAECLDLALDVRTASDAAPDAGDAVDRPVLACAFRLSRAGDPPRTWTLALRASRANAGGYLGSLRDDRSGAEYDVASSHALEGSGGRRGAPAGFTVVRGDDLVELVETLGSGRIWIGRGTRDADALAAAATALLLFRPTDA